MGGTAAGLRPPERLTAAVMSKSVGQRLAAATDDTATAAAAAGEADSLVRQEARTSPSSSNSRDATSCTLSSSSCSHIQLHVPLIQSLSDQRSISFAAFERVTATRVPASLFLSLTALSCQEVQQQHQQENMNMRTIRRMRRNGRRSAGSAIATASATTSADSASSCPVADDDCDHVRDFLLQSQDHRHWDSGSCYCCCYY